MYGEGLIKGLAVTLRYFFSRKVTQLYPEVMPELPPAVKSSFKVDQSKCIACGICANACPNNVITLTTEKDENNKRRLTGYEMNMQYCLFCGLCAESCPTNAVIVEQDFELAAFSRENTKYRLVMENQAKPAATESEGAKE